MRLVSSIAVLLLSVQIHGSSMADFGRPCDDISIQARRSGELQKLRAADQGDRTWQWGGNQPSLSTLERMAKNDLLRRKRVGAIFGEGCLKSMADYEAAFTVFQHGTTPDQYFQAFLWAKQALVLGNTQGKGDVAMAIDRYLVSVGHKQLFGTQASKSDLSGCWCIQPIEDSVPQTMRDEYRGGANAAYTGLAYLKILNGEKNCPPSYCPTDLRASPHGTVVGFW